MRRLQIDSLRNRHLLFLDVLLTALAPFLLYALRFEGFDWPAAHVEAAAVFAAMALPLCIATYYAFGLYRRLWRYAGIPELELIFLACVSASVVSFFAGRIVAPALGISRVPVPLSVLFTGGILSLILVATPRMLIRIGRGAHRRGNHAKCGRRVLIVGAGSAGQMILRELRHNAELQLVPIGFLDDDPAKAGLSVAGLSVIGPLSRVRELITLHRIDELLIAMPSVAGSVIRSVVQAALDAGIQTRTIPSFSEIITGQVEVARLREVRIEDLLRREPVRTNMDQVRALATDRTVLVTGAGGSIGSELARQIARLRPEKLLLLGHGENPIFHVLNELRAAYPDLVIVPVIADIRHRRRMFAVMDKHRPFAVFHAAAHKHVPLMEDNVVEAITNNVKGTSNLVDAAAAAGVEHFVFISTDKAVHPTSVMGASKRIAEHVVRGAALRYGKNFVVVRFGNVLGSQGSVVPTFLQQIRAGGPVVVTHPDMCRYFMTIPEAVQLVLQAGAIGRGGELFMLDMGEPVKIVDLALDLIRLSGLEVGTDIDIRYSGIRPGEKLYEEMFFGHETTVNTEHPKVLRATDVLKPGDAERIAERIKTLIDARFENASDEALRRMIHTIVPDYVWTPAITAMPTESDEARSSSSSGRRVGPSLVRVN